MPDTDADDRLSQREIPDLKALAKEGKSIPYIALVLHRASSIYSKPLISTVFNWICGDVSLLTPTIPEDRWRQLRKAGISVAPPVAPLIG